MLKGRSVHREIEDLVDGAILGNHSGVGVGVDGESAPSFHTDRESTFGVRRNGMQELVQTSPIRTASRLGGILRNVAISSNVGTEAGVAVVGCRARQHCRQAVLTTNQTAGW